MQVEARQLLMHERKRIGVRGDDGFPLVDDGRLTTRYQRGARLGDNNIKTIMRMFGKAGMQQHRPGPGT